VADGLNIPALGSDVPIEIRRAFDAIREWGTGVPFYISNTAKLNSQVSVMANSVTPVTNYPIPTLGIEATGAFRTIMIEWPLGVLPSDARVEVWRRQWTGDSDAGAMGDATMIGTTQASVYTDSPPVTSLTQKFWYWVRITTASGRKGAFSNSALASTATDPAYLLAYLTGNITAGNLDETLQGVLNDYSGLQQQFTSVVQNIPYKVEIISSNGIYVRRTDVDSEVLTTLTAKVYRGTADITGGILDRQFQWTRVSAPPYGVIPDDTDAAWNGAHTSGSRSIQVTSKDVHIRSTFTCTINE
jgi:hypothetical protein